MSIIYDRIVKFKQENTKCYIKIRYYESKKRMYTGYVIDCDETATIFKDKYGKEIVIVLSEILEIEAVGGGGRK